MLRSPVVMLAALALIAIAGLSRQPPAGMTDAEAEALLYDLTHTGGQSAQHAMERILATDDKRFIAAYIELQRAIVFDTERDAHLETLETLSGQNYGRDWVAWREWYATTSYAPPPGFIAWKGILMGRIDPGFRDFLYTGAPATIRVEEIVWGGVGVDGIPPLEQPRMLAAAEANRLVDGEPVFGLFVNGEARAYPLRVMDQHEMANDVIGGEPVSLAYCTLCGAGIAYRTTQPDGTSFDFGTSGLLYRSNKLMYDRQTKTLWNHLTGEPVVGALAGTGVRLDILPIVLTTWAEWRYEHPTTLVLDLDTGFGRQYTPGEPYGDYFSSSGTWFPTPGDDDRLADKTQVFAIEINGAPKAYPLDILLDAGAINDTLGGVELVIVGSGNAIDISGTGPEGVSFSYQAGGAARAYQRDGQSFRPGGDEGTLLDAHGNVWRVTEEALIGPSSERLERLPGHLAFWFGWSNFFPDTDVFQP